MLVLDTDVITLVQHPDGVEYARLLARLDGIDQATVFATIISFEEQCRGWLAQIAKTKTPERQIVAYGRLSDLLIDFCDRNVLKFDQPAAVKYQELVKAKLRIGTMDLKIAAIALAHDATLLSRNLADFRKVPGLRVEDWTAPDPAPPTP